MVGASFCSNFGQHAGIDSLSINTVRTLCMDAVQQANSGHPMAMAPVLYLQWQEYLRFDAEDPIWPLQKLVKKFSFTIDAVVSAATKQVNKGRQ